MSNRTNRSIPLSDREEEKLTVLAAEHGAYSKTGPTAGMPSWRRLVSEIATGEFMLRRRKGAVVPAEVSPVMVAPAAVDASLPLWWPREEDGSLSVFARVSGERAKQCEAMGLELDDLGFVARGEWLVPVENAPEHTTPRKTTTDDA